MEPRGDGEREIGEGELAAEAHGEVVGVDGGWVGLGWIGHRGLRPPSAGGRVLGALRILGGCRG